MVRTADPSRSEYTTGPVRVVKRGEAYRVLWTENGRQRERQVRSLSAARQVANQEAHRLELEAGTGLGHETTFDVLISRGTDPGVHNWSPEWESRIRSIAQNQVIPELGKIPCGDLDRSHINAFLKKLAAEEYSYHFIQKVKQVLAMGIKEGVKAGLWNQHDHPLTEIEVPRRGRQLSKTTGRPDLRKIPTDTQVEELIAELSATSPQFGVMAMVAAYTGVRWGELSALTVESVDLSKRRLSVEWNCIQSDRGSFRFEPPAKSYRGVRDIVIDRRLEEPLDYHIRRLDPDWEPGTGIEGNVPGRLLFFNSNNNPYTRNWWGQLWGRARDKVTDWPDGATWHYLRHYAATSWLKSGLELAVVQAMLGHTQLSTTVDWYVNLDADALDRAAEVL